MEPGRFESPRAIACSESGTLACLDRDGARLWYDGGPHDLDAPASAIAFHDAQLALLVGEEVRRFGRPGAVPVPANARCLAFTMSGGLLVGSAERLERTGAHPLEHVLPAGFDLCAITVDPGGYWLGGASALIGYRPTAGGLELRVEHALERPVRALAYGPDGCVHALLDDARSVLRDGTPIVRLEQDCYGLARRGRALIGLGEHSLLDLTRHLAEAPTERPDLDLPACDG